MSFQRCPSFVTAPDGQTVLTPAASAGTLGVISSGIHLFQTHSDEGYFMPEGNRRRGGSDDGWFKTGRGQSRRGRRNRVRGLSANLFPGAKFCFVWAVRSLCNNDVEICECCVACGDRSNGESKGQQKESLTYTKSHWGRERVQWYLV